MNCQATKSPAHQPSTEGSSPRLEIQIKGTTYIAISSFNGDTNKDLKSTMLRMICRDLDMSVSPTKQDNVGA